MLTLGDGSYLKSPQVTMIPVRAFRIEPATSNGYMTIDGESVPVGPIQAELLPGAGRVISRWRSEESSIYDTVMNVIFKYFNLEQFWEIFSPPLFDSTWQLARMLKGGWSLNFSSL